MSEKANDPILRKLSDGRTDGQTDRQTNESGFVGRCPKEQSFEVAKLFNYYLPLK